MTYIGYSAIIPYFSTFAISGSQVEIMPALNLSPLNFEVTNLVINPTEAEIGEAVTISADVTNFSDEAATYVATLWIDSTIEAGQGITMEAGETESVVFTVTRAAEGSYEVRLDRLIGSFNISEVVEAPASFAISDLSVTPSKVKPREQVTISALVTNTGGSEGSYTVVLKINGVEETKKEVILGAGKSETVTFTITKDTEGTYTVNIAGKVGRFTAIVPPLPTLTPTEAPPAPVEPFNWPLIGGLIAGCLVVAGLLGYFFVWRKRGAPRLS